MTNEDATTLERKQFSNHYASRLLNRVLSDRKKADDRTTEAEMKSESNHRQVKAPVGK